MGDGDDKPKTHIKNFGGLVINKVTATLTRDLRKEKKERKKIRDEYFEELNKDRVHNYKGHDIAIAKYNEKYLETLKTKAIERKK